MSDKSDWTDPRPNPPDRRCEDTTVATCVETAAETTEMGEMEETPGIADTTTTVATVETADPRTERRPPDLAIEGARRSS